MREFLRNHKDIIPYAVFGVLTTLLNIVAYWFLAHPLGLPVMASTVIAWIITVTAAYLTNRRWVFHSEARTAPEIFREVVWFFACRIATGVLDWVIMYVFVTRLHLPDVPIKAAANILVILINYIASKRIIFRRKR